MCKPRLSAAAVYDFLPYATLRMRDLFTVNSALAHVLGRTFLCEISERGNVTLLVYYNIIA